MSEEPTGPPAPARPSGLDPMIGVVLRDQYRIEKPVGKGGTGRVYMAVQGSLARRVAVKVLRPELDPAAELRFEDRFFREASLAGALQHPNVVTVHDYGRTDDGLCFIVMELLGGRSLKALMGEGPIEAERALQIFEQILRGLRHAHEAGLVHRDVKPGNVQLIEGDDGYDFVKLLDFGLVKADEETSELTGAGTFLGTPHYASPEQVKGLDADARSDLYSVGVMLYRALTGVLPYWSRNPMAIALAHVRDPYPPMAERAPDASVAPRLEAIVRRCMEKDAAARYPDASTLLAEIVAARRVLFPDAPTLELSVPEPSVLVPAPRRAPRWPLAVVAVLLAAVGGVSWMGAQLESPALAPPAPADVPLPFPADRTVHLLISSDPAGATVLLDGGTLGVTPLATSIEIPDDELNPERTFVLRADGHEDAQLLLALADDQAAGHATLLPTPAPARAQRRSAAQAPSSERPAAAAAGTVTPSGTTPRSASHRADRAGGDASSDGSASAGASGTVQTVAAVADGVRFTSAQAERALGLANSGDKNTLRAAGVAGRQINIILDGRPWGSLDALAATPYIGKGTMESLRGS